MLKKLAAVAIALTLFATQAFPALACGALVAPNGSVRLARATTLVAWHDGVERYLSSFSYQGDFSNLGWIVPLPAVPMNIEEGGAWTLQRLERESHILHPDRPRAHSTHRQEESPRVRHALTSLIRYP